MAVVEVVVVVVVVVVVEAGVLKTASVMQFTDRNGTAVAGDADTVAKPMRWQIPKVGVHTAFEGGGVGGVGRETTDHVTNTDLLQQWPLPSATDAGAARV